MPRGWSACTPPNAAGTRRCATAWTACTVRRAVRETSTACARSFSVRRSSCPVPPRASHHPQARGRGRPSRPRRRPGRAAGGRRGPGGALRRRARPHGDGDPRAGRLGDTVVIPIPQRDRFHGVLVAAGGAEGSPSTTTPSSSRWGASGRDPAGRAPERRVARVLRRRPPHAGGGDRCEGSPVARALRGGRSLRRGDGPAAGGRAGRAAAALARVAPARRRHRRGVRTRPAQAGPAERPGARGRGGAPTDRGAGSSHRFPRCARWSPRSSITTSASTAPAIPTASRATRSRPRTAPRGR